MLTSPQRRRAPPANSPNRRSGPANDNSRLRVIVPTSPARLARLGSTVLRLNPYIRLAGMALDILEILSAPRAAGYQPAGGWYKAAECANPTYTGAWARNSQNSSHPPTQAILNLVCLGGQARQSGSINNPFGGLSATTRTIAIGKSGGLLGSQMQIHEIWTSPTPNASPKPEWAEARPAIALPPPLPQYWPISLEPALAKPGQAPAFPPAVPWRMPQSQRQAPNREARYEASPSRRRQVAPATNPAQVPNEWSVSIGVGASAPQAAPKTHELAVPTGTGSPVKETKAKLSPAQAKILMAVSIGTESLDFIDAIYDALPERYRPRFRDTDYELRSVSPLQKAQAIFDNLENIDINDAIFNLIYENIEDKFYGTFGKMGGEISKRTGKAYGAGMNSVATRFRKSTYNSEDEDRERVDGEN